jgi:hypothetical protein
MNPSKREIRKTWAGIIKYHLLSPENEGFLHSGQIKTLQMHAYSLQAQSGE